MGGGGAKIFLEIGIVMDIFYGLRCEKKCFPVSD